MNMKKFRIFKVILVIVLLIYISSCKDAYQYNVNVSNVIKLMKSTDSIPANGISIITLRAIITDSADIGKKSITFTTTQGTFNNGSTTITVLSDTSGVANTYLKSSNFIGKVSLTAQVSNYLINDSVYFTSITNVDSAIILNTSASNTPADGQSIITLTAKISDTAAANGRSVTFNTNQGAFIGGTTNITVPANLNGFAIAYLKSSNYIGKIAITAQVTNYIVSDSVYFTIANPNFINVTIPQFSLIGSLTNSVTVTAQLLRDTGTVSPSFNVMYKSLDSTNSRVIGNFINITLSNSNGISTALYSAIDSLYLGKVNISASVVVSPGDTIKGTSSLIIVSH